MRGSRKKNLERHALLKYFYDSYAYDDGFSDGVSHGISEGISQGSHDKAVETARKMIERNMAFEDICELTGLSLNEIKRIVVSN